MNSKTMTALAVFLFALILVVLVSLGGRPVPNRDNHVPKRAHPISSRGAPRIISAEITQTIDETNAASAETIPPQSETIEAEVEPQAPSDETRTLYMQSTAYGPPDFPAGQTTASGASVGPGSIAVDPRVIPLGTRLWIEGYGEGIANDTGGAIVGNIIDVWLPSYEQCIQWGRRWVTVEILD
ncbi:MAG: 3D domain-containing protein [Candidatus Aquicultorales bacterium]